MEENLIQGISGRSKPCLHRQMYSLHVPSWKWLTIIVFFPDLHRLRAPLKCLLTKIRSTECQAFLELKQLLALNLLKHYDPALTIVITADE